MLFARSRSSTVQAASPGSPPSWTPLRFRSENLRPHTLHRFVHTTCAQVWFRWNAFPASAVHSACVATATQPDSMQHDERLSQKRVMNPSSPPAGLERTHAPRPGFAGGVLKPLLWNSPVPNRQSATPVVTPVPNEAPWPP